MSLFPLWWHMGGAARAVSFVGAIFWRLRKHIWFILSHQLHSSWVNNPAVCKSVVFLLSSPLQLSTLSYSNFLSSKGVDLFLSAWLLSCLYGRKGRGGEFFDGEQEADGSNFLTFSRYLWHKGLAPSRGFRRDLCINFPSSSNRMFVISSIR